MGCGSSRHNELVMSGAHEGRCAIKADGQVFLCEFAGQTLPKKGKNQDRFGIKFAGNALTVRRLAFLFLQNDTQVSLWLGTVKCDLG